MKKTMIIILSSTLFLISCSKGFQDAYEYVTGTGFLFSKWTRLSGVMGKNTTGSEIAADLNGNSYVIGSTSGNLDGQSLIGLGDGFVIKYNSAGIKQWTRLSGVSGKYTNNLNLVISTNGDFYVSGSTNGNLDGQTLNGTDDVFVIKYNSDGVKLWTKLSGASGQSTSGYGISMDNYGYLYVGGFTRGNLDGQTLNGTGDAFVMKYNSEGIKQWTRLSGVAGKLTVGWGGIGADPNGNIYIAGLTQGNLGGQTLTGVDDLFVIKYDTNGIKQWTRLSGVSGKSTQGYSIAVDKNGNSYVTGSTDGNLDGQISTGGGDAFVIKYNTNGVKQWTRLLSTGSASRFPEGKLISLDSVGNSYITGCTSLTVDGQVVTGIQDVFAIKYNSDGVKQWTRLLGYSSVVTCGNSIFAHPSGKVFVSGNTNGNLDGQSLTGIQDAFVTTRLNP